MAARRSEPTASPGEIEKAAEHQPAEGDLSGPYGYGRPAHVPDPGASYAFRPDDTRILPRNRKMRWKVSG